MKYAIVDIETTGGSIAYGRITEIAIVISDGKKVLNRFSSLVNPNQLIPPNITRLTGIDNEMVADAPLFNELIPKIDELTKDAVFVAHNVNFDYGFIRESYNRAGEKFQRKKLCTVRLSRKILPGFYSYSLGKLCAQLDIDIKNRHRALGDADATAILFHYVVKMDHQDFILESLHPRSKEALLPPHLDKQKFEEIPSKMGIYYFFNQKKKVIYIGKANDLKKRVHSHFSGNTNTKSKNNFAENIYDVTYQVCSNELITLLTEAHEVKKHWPIHNRALKKFNLNFGLFYYIDQNNYGRFLLGKSGKNTQPIAQFKTAHESRKFLEDICAAFELCPKYCSLQTPTSGSCYDYTNGDCNGACADGESAEEYQKRFEAAVGYIKRENFSYLIVGEGSESHLQSLVLVERGRYKGFGEAPKSIDLKSVEMAIQHINYGYDDQDIQVLIHSYLRKAKEEDVVVLER